MIAVILKSNSQMVAMMTIWNSAAELKPVLERINGFISVELFQSLTKPKKILSLSFFEDKEAIAQWRNLTGHRRTQGKGRNSVFSEYRLRIVTVVRNYGRFNRGEAPMDSRFIHDKATAKSNQS
ncbi:MAG: antibiotic biosynthesis monooxygenase family protein [Rhodobacterales bacterium]|jgi:heme-degrading monooxygenase HmoA